MLQKRTDFAISQLKETRRLGSFPAGVTIDSESLTAFLEMLADNFRSNRDLLALIDNIAGGNMRLALRFVTEFIGSGHIDTTKILEIYNASRSYRIPLHEFLRALLFGDGIYYDADASPIANLFQVTQADGREHFLLPLLLSQVQTLGERVGEDGYVTADDLYNFAQRLGFNVDQIAASLDHAVVQRLLDVAPRYSGERPRLHYRITTVGAYTTRILLAYFAYADAVVTDTPIVDEQYRKLITDAHTLSERLARSEYFRLYLDRQWAKIVETKLPWYWSETSKRLAEDIRQVGRRTDPSTWGRRN